MAEFGIAKASAAIHILQQVLRISCATTTIGSSHFIVANQVEPAVEFQRQFNAPFLPDGQTFEY